MDKYSITAATYYANRTCSHYIICEWGVGQAICLHILFRLIDHRVYNYSSTWENYIF